ncbi:MAG: hypothetical protein HY762_07920 [Planctomycetes bacterium]|nr:hypothetical protein [Planctomycetota bacterium]
MPYLPKNDQAKADFMDNLGAKLPDHAATLGLSPAEVASVQADAAMFNYLMDMQEAYKTNKQEVTGYKNVLRDGPLGAPLGPVPVAPTLPAAPAAVSAGIFIRVSQLVMRIKGNPAYNKQTIGEDLGIVGDEQTIDIPNLKPVLNSRLDAERPLIIWKKGPADSIDIYVDRKDGLGFVFLATDTQPDYLDTFPIPAGITTALWDYKAIYKIGDDQVGRFSEPIQVTVTRKTGY